ncbi:Rapid ALkalinization Factor protein [Dioscorea alata]|uniref:Rapid ALkalinization Factor protein n=1 Tax=Dioscorea alata TaxID=55571 RepID=A0ACB7W665_DIOAL|nr:Rapid ALkalinization Factor protein [Dioscorea alata]
MLVFLLSLVVVEGMQMQMKKKVACNNGTSVGECFIEAEEEWSFESETGRRMLAGGRPPISTGALERQPPCDGKGGRPYTLGGVNKNI